MRPLDREEEAMRPHDQSVSPYLRRPLRSHEEVLRERRRRAVSSARPTARPSDTGRSPGRRSGAAGKDPSIDVGKP